MKRKYAFVILITIISFLLTSCSSTNGTGSVDTNKLTDEIETYISDEFEKSHLPGMSIEVVSSDEVLFSGVYGEAHSADQQFILGSLSKSFTALSIMQLEEKKQLSVDDCVAKYLPEFDQDSKTTIRQLLTHSSGLKTSATMEKYKSSDTPKPYTYSNQNFNLLGRIVEEVSGESYGDYVRAHIFDPLGMTHSYVSYDDAVSDDLISGSRNFMGFYFHQKMPYPKNMTSGWMTVSAAYIISSANDMGKYLQWYLGDSGNEVLSSANRKKMFTETVSASGEHGPQNYEYGFGWGIYDDGSQKVYMHGGNVENYTTYMILVPDKNIGVIALTNSCDFLVADEYTTLIPRNVSFKIQNMQTNDIPAGEYWRKHLLYDVIMFVLLIACCMPILRLKKWCKKGHKIVAGFISVLIIHIIIPTFLLTASSITIDRPLYVVMRFAPDVFVILIISALCLYAAGLIKAVHLIRHRNSKSIEKQKTE